MEKIQFKGWSEKKEVSFKELLDNVYCEISQEMKSKLIEKFRSLGKASLEFGFSDDYFGSKFRNNDKVPINLLEKLSPKLNLNVEINKIYPKNSDKPIIIPREFRNKLVARIVGNILGDGCIDKTFTVRYSNTKKEL